ncbi:hypothetical protein STEG23_008855 [Scotinomys teguina]
MTVTPLGRDQDCSLKNRELDVPAPWFLDPGGWSKTAAVSLYFIFPGICTLSLTRKEKFHKSQHWGFCNNVRMLVSEEKPGIGGELLPGQKIRPRNSIYPKGDGADAPSWVAFDKQKTRIQFLALESSGSQLLQTPVPGDPQPPSDLCGHQAPT